MTQCECGLCETVPHDSDCAVHNEPATPNGDCDCKGEWHSRRTDELLLIQFVNDQGWDCPDLVEAAERLARGLEEELIDYSVLGNPEPTS